MTDPLAELLPPLTRHEALVEADRCLNCYDSPCTQACPTHINIPRFIKKIATGNVTGSARTILESNLLGATCSRVCPVQELCEGACVLGAEHKPVMIGRLQRYAMDNAGAKGFAALPRAKATGKSVAVVGAGPAGLSCAGQLAQAGHRVTVFEKNVWSGGLSTYGIIALREPVEVALAEVRMIETLGVTVQCGVTVTPEELKGFDAVFLSVGLGATPQLGIPGEERILDGLEYIRQSKLERASLQIGRQVIVIGAGNTAIDCATIAKRLGAETVTMVYRRTSKEMTAYPHERDFVRREGVEIRFLTQSVRVVEGGLECIRMALGQPDSSGRATPEPVPGSEFTLPADQIVKAIGQQRPAIAAQLGLRTERGLIAVNQDFETSVPGIFAGGDCVRVKGAASTVMAVEDGKLAAAAIARRLA